MRATRLALPVLATAMDLLPRPVVLQRPGQMGTAAKRPLPRSPPGRPKP
jgi:hypothetical protein